MSTRHPIDSAVTVETASGPVPATYLGHYTPEPDRFDVVQLEGADWPSYVHMDQVKAAPPVIGGAVPGDRLLCLPCAVKEPTTGKQVTTADLPDGEWCDACKTALAPVLLPARDAA